MSLPCSVDGRPFDVVAGSEQQVPRYSLNDGDATDKFISQMNLMENFDIEDALRTTKTLESGISPGMRWSRPLGKPARAVIT